MVGYVFISYMPRNTPVMAYTTFERISVERFTTPPLVCMFFIIYTVWIVGISNY